MTNLAQDTNMLRRMDVGKVLAPVSGNGVDEEVIRMACNLARESDASVRAVCVIEVERSLPLDAPVEQETARAESILARAQEYARDAGYDIDTDLLQAREAGPAIVHEAEAAHADLIVMGVAYRRRAGIVDIGETTTHVLREAPCHVVLYRAAVNPEDRK